LTNAGAGLPPAAATALATAFPNARIYLMYGQTECIRVCFLAPELISTHTASVGRPIPGSEAWVETEDGRRAAPGEVGELVVRGAHVMPGYWRDPEATSKKLCEGRWPWERVLHTGDLFRTDADGLLYFVSRTDDIIKSRGEKVPPREVEDVLLHAGGVRDAAVVGVPDDLLGEAVHAHVTPLPGHSLDPRALRAFCARHLEAHMIPRGITVHDELPKSENGKIDRMALMGRVRPPFEAPE
jgi:acyl-CoA synthetase (AMP-forming)/AMP-acid ligase II